ncbi:proclotting enzyme-like [Sitodiplosis mosellana]|uniref:proclotting enzyme-like n=1 Tax=Sitodiplosis mosellana TaxID=263140 RepID=UPI0024442D53|nr:proclotting enzyme-like [Sitodiplosis mosellana]
MITGWINSGNVNKYQLHQISVPIWSNKQCEQVPEYNGRFTHNMIGAGEYKNGTRTECSLDIGQMFIDGEHGGMEMIGIYTFGTKCGILGMPAIYTRVDKFMPWIKHILSNECMCVPKTADQDVSLQKYDSCDCG